MTTWTIEVTRSPSIKSAYKRSVYCTSWSLVWNIWRSIQANGRRYRLKRNNLIIARKK